MTHPATSPFSRSRNRACLAIAFAATSVGFGAGQASASTVEQRSCERVGATVVKETKYAKVLRLRNRLYGCLRSRGKLVSFGEVASFGYFLGQQGPISMNGRWVAFGMRSGSRSGIDFEFRVVDLRGRAVVRAPLPVIQDLAPLPDEDTGFTAVSVTPRGTAAWIIKSYGPSPNYEVWTADTALGSTSFRSRLVAQGSDIEPLHLRTTETRVGWLRAGEQQSAPRR